MEKKREVLKLKKNTSEEKILEIIKDNEKLKNYIQNKEIIKKIFVPNKNYKFNSQMKN